MLPPAPVPVSVPAPSPGPVPSAAALAPLDKPRPRWWLPLAAGLLLLGLFPFLMLLATSVLGLPRYEVQGGQIVARALASRTVIPAGTAVERAQLRGLTRRYGSSLAGYEVGRFGSDRGELAVYSNGAHEGLLFATQPPTFLTPQNPEALLAAWRQGGVGSFRPAPVPLTQNLGLLLLTLPGCVIVVSLLLVKPRLTYEISGDALVVRTRASTTTLPRRQTRAELTSEPLGSRLFGTGMPGYYTGTFANRSGRVQAAATHTRPERALLLTHGNQRYYLTPSDPAAVAAWFGEGEMGREKG